MATLTTPNGVIAYSLQGSGPPLVILRGLGRSVKHWLGYDQMLARDFRVVTLDFRGLGGSTAAYGWTASLYDLAADIFAVLDAAEIEAAHIMGVSLGGMVTLAAGLTCPARCLSLVTVNTSIGGLRTLRLSPAAMATLAAAALERGEPFHRRLVDVLVGSECSPERRQEIVKQYVDIAELDGLYPQTVLKQLLAAGRFLVKRRLQKLDVPTLVVYGTDDKFVPNINSRKLVQYLPDVKLVAIHGGGHELSLDKPAELAAAVKEWVRELASRGAPRSSR